MDSEGAALSGKAVFQGKLDDQKENKIQLWSHQRLDRMHSVGLT